MKKETADKVRDELLNCVKQTLKRVAKDNGDHRPFHKSLLSEQIILLSKFERSFSTSFGQKVIESISKFIAAEVKGTTDVQNQKHSEILIGKAALDSIENHVSQLRQNKLGRSPKWKDDLLYIAKNDKKEKVRIISDLWFKRKGEEYYFSIKTVKPNIDQTAEAKRDMMKLYAQDPNSNVFLALPYNPYGEDRKNYDHSPPFKIFDMVNDHCVLIGKEYWDLIGGKGTYQELLEITNEAGKKTKKLIWEAANL